ncbi:UNVERIFIED_CONTAM: hypothetical protein Sangu_0430500 [Sesamum angustifolium]|uniref:Retrovirus-related Pol polyprotein from transposon TNT 1-94-like beta-barrel domain-containing protein n=1 Tax=Sesamum angustifolium TaxID=2727405 RepID=A0AAW2QTU2_9LAMI
MNEAAAAAGLDARSTSGASAAHESDDLKIHTSDFPDIAKAFSYAKSARSLWLQLEARFGQANGPMIYNLQREIASVSQGNMDIVSYFTKIAMLWDELECVDPTPECSCSSQRTMADKVASTQLMQFLMGLNDSFDAIRSQILVMDPLPSVDKAYSLVLRVESQRQSSINMQDINDNGYDRHSKESCFKLHGYPEWFKDLTDKRKRYGSDARALNAIISDSAVVPQQEVTTQTLSVMMSELLQMMKGKTQSDQAQVNYAKMGEFAAIHAESSVALPDGTKKHVTHCGSVTLSPDVTLNAVLYMPSFKCNLLSVSKLSSLSHITILFSRDHCVMQDQRTKRTIAVGLVGNLYVLDDFSFNQDE